MVLQEWETTFKQIHVEYSTLFQLNDFSSLLSFTSRRLFAFSRHCAVLFRPSCVPCLFVVANLLYIFEVSTCSDDEQHKEEEKYIKTITSLFRPLSTENCSHRSSSSSKCLLSHTVSIVNRQEEQQRKVRMHAVPDDEHKMNKCLLLIRCCWMENWAWTHENMLRFGCRLQLSSSPSASWPSHNSWDFIAYFCVSNDCKNFNRRSTWCIFDASSSLHAFSQWQRLI